MTLLGFLRDLIAPKKEEGTSNAGHRYSRRFIDAKDEEEAELLKVLGTPWQYEYDNNPKGRVRTGAMSIDNDQLRFAVNRLLAQASQKGYLDSKNPSGKVAFTHSGKVASLTMKHPTRGEIVVDLFVPDKPSARQGSFNYEDNHLILVGQPNEEITRRDLERHLQRVFAHEWTHSLDKEVSHKTEEQKQAEDVKNIRILRKNSKFSSHNMYLNRKREVTATIQEIVFSLTTKEAVAKLRKDAEYAATSDKPVHFRSGRGMVQQALLVSPRLQEANRANYTEANKKRIWRAVADTYNAIMDNKIRPLEGYLGPKR